MNGAVAPGPRIIFIGPMGVGKSTAIATVSDPAAAAIVTPDARDKGYDIGVVDLDGNGPVQLIGVSSDSSERQRWQVPGEEAGVVLLLDAGKPDVLMQMERYLDLYADVVREGVILIGIGRGQQAHSLPLAAFQHRLEGRPSPIPVFSVDVRRRDDVVLLIETVLCMREADARVAAFR